LGRGITESVYGDNEPIYSLREQNEEQKMLSMNRSLAVLLEELDNKEKPTEQKDES
jgi:hypothetical protein